MATENMNQMNLQTTDGKSYAFTVVDQEARDLAQQALDAAGSGGSGDCNIQRIESESSNYVYLRDLASGLYVLYGYFRPFNGSGTRLVYDNVLASVAADDTGSHILTFDTVNSKINFVEVLVDDKQTSGFYYNRTAISLLDLHGLIAKIGDMDGLSTTEKSTLVAAINEVAANAGGSDGGENLDYSTATNKPSINGVELNGDKTAAELGIGQPSDEQVGAAVGDWLEKHPEATTVVADGSITPAKTTFIEPVVQNLIDISKMVKGGIAEATGEIGTTAGYTSDYIPVETGKTYRCNVGFGTGGNWASYYYDADKKTVSIIEGNPFTVPEGAAYVRLSWYLNDDPLTKQYALFEGVNTWPFTQGTQRYELDGMLTTAVERVVDRYAAVKAVPKNLYRQAGYGNVNGATGVIDCGDAGSLRVSDYIELTPGVWYITNCLSAPGFSACYDSDKKYVAAFADAAERIDASGYYAFCVTNPDVRYIVNGCEKSISKPISEPFFCRGSAVPETFDGYDVAVPQADVILALKNLLGITGNELAGLTWAVLGDSTTAGSGNTQTYHSIIAAELGITAINHGYNGSWVSYNAEMDGIEMCTRYAEMTDDADIITVCGGINDINNGATLGEMGDTEKTTFYGALDILCQGLHRKYPGKRIGYITPMNYGDDAKAEPYLEAIHKVCGKYAIPVLDMYHDGLACATTEELSAIYTRDGLHQSDFGHAVQARKVKAFLQRL